MAQSFWVAIAAFSSCFLVTVAVSLATKARPESELKGLVHGFTEKPPKEDVPWYMRPAPLSVVAGVMCLILNIIFW